MRPTKETYKKRNLSKRPTKTSTGKIYQKTNVTYNLPTKLRYHTHVIRDMHTWRKPYDMDTCMTMGNLHTFLHAEYYIHCTIPTYQVHSYIHCIIATYPIHSVIPTYLRTLCHSYHGYIYSIIQGGEDS